MNHVYQIYLSNWYLYYYYIFLGEHLILADLVDGDEQRSQRQSGLHRQHGPHQERLFGSVRRVGRWRCPKTSSENIKHYLKTDRPLAFFKNIIIICFKRVKADEPTKTDKRQRQDDDESSKKQPMSCQR